MLGKKTKTKASEHDFASLDQAVNELTQQTEALLGKNGEKAVVPKKPTLPKKKVKLPSKGHHFDIINKTSMATKIDHNNDTKSVTQGAAVGSEASVDDPITPQVKSSPAPIISGHRSGSLSTEATTSETLQNTAPPKKTEPSQSSEPHEKSIPVSKEAAVTPAPAAPTAPASKKEAIQSEEADDTIDLTESPTDSSNEVYASNLLSEKAPKGFQAKVNQQKPSVFDTNEYHPPLHDWSKLGHNHGGTWLLIVCLLIAGIAVGYLLFKDNLPF